MPTIGFAALKATSTSAARASTGCEDARRLTAANHSEAVCGWVTARPDRTLCGHPAMAAREAPPTGSWDLDLLRGGWPAASRRG
jgi:hypothetical protein